MNIDKNANPTTKLVFDVLSDRQRSRKRTDLNNLFRIVQRLDSNVDHRAFIEVFKALDSNGAGKLIIGRRGNPDRFIWGYNLRDLAAKIKMNGISPATIKQMDLVTDAKQDIAPVKRAKKSPVRHIGALKAKPGRPRKQAVAAKSESLAQPVVLNVTLDPNMSQADMIALVQLITGKKA